MVSRAPAYHRDIYNCVKCDGWVGKDYFCKYCGHKFNSADTGQMVARSAKQKKIDQPMFNGFGELYKCQSCKGPVGHKHNFCKSCGIEISVNDKLKMNSPNQFWYEGPLVFFAILAVFVISAAVLIIN